MAPESPQHPNPDEIPENERTVHEPNPSGRGGHKTPPDRQPPSSPQPVGG